MGSPLGRVLILGACIVIVAAGMRAAMEFLAPALLALLIAIAVQPLIRWCTRRGLPEWVSVLLVVLSGVILGTGLLIYLSVAIARLLSHLPAYETTFSVRLALLTAGHHLPGFHGITSGMFSAERIFGVLGNLLGILAHGFASGLLTLLFFVVFASESLRVSTLMKAEVGAESPAMSRFSTLAAGITTYFSVRAIINLIKGVSLALLFRALHIDHAVLWGVLAFFLSFIPSIGLPIAIAPAILLAWVQHGGVIAAIAIGGAIVIELVAEYVLSPRMSGQALNISTATVIFSFIFWAWIFGVLGVLISVPLTAIVMVALDNYDDTRWIANLMRAGEETSRQKAKAPEE